MNLTEILNKTFSEVSRITGIKFSDSTSEVDKLHALTEIPSFSEQTQELTDKVDAQAEIIETQNSQMQTLESKISSIETALSGLSNLKAEILSGIDSKISASEKKISKEILDFKNTTDEKVVEEIETGAELKVQKVQGEVKLAGKPFSIK